MAGDYCGILAQLVSQMRLSDCDDDLARVYVRTGWIRWRREEANVENRERVSWRRCGRRISPFYTQTGFFPSPGINYSRPPLADSNIKFGGGALGPQQWTTQHGRLDEKPKSLGAGIDHLLDGRFMQL